MTDRARRSAHTTEGSAEDTEDDRRRFGALLRSYRERATPYDVGLARGGIRKTPGLRREEVAVLAGMGVSWYSWLEQGRDIRPSVDVLRALASTLRLTEMESFELFEIAEKIARRPAVRPSRQKARPPERS